MYRQIILLTAAQRRWLQQQAKAKGESLSTVVRSAISAQMGAKP